MKFSLLPIALLAAPFVYAGAPPPDVPPAPDTVCPADVSSVIQGGPWAFQLRSPAFDPQTSTAAVGTFTAKPNGVLSAILTVSNANAAVMRRAEAPGRYILYPNCTGGEVMIMLNGFAAQLEFVWTNNFTQMLFVADELNPRYGGTTILIGNAKRGPTACPAGLGNPLNILNATTWSYQLFAGYFPQGGFGGGGSASVGTLRPYVQGSLGLLKAIDTTVAETSPNDSTAVYRLAELGGRYLIYGDCSGGEIMLMNRRPGSLQLEFVFVGTNFDEMYFLADDASSAGDVSMVGQAYRY